MHGLSGSRLGAKHQSLRANIVTTAEGLFPGRSLCLTVLRLVLGGHSRAPQTQRSALRVFGQHALEMRPTRRPGGILLCAEPMRTLLCPRLVRWCNGSTRPFGGLCPGSNPGRTAKLPNENGGLENHPKDSPNIPGQPEDESDQNVKFPKRLRHNGRGKVLATIYQRPDGFRLYWRARVDGKPRSRFKDFPSYSAAKREGDKVVADLAKGKASTILSPGQAADALNAVEELQRHFQATGKRLSIRFAVGEYCELSRKLGDRSPGDAVDGYLATVATVKRVDLKEAAEQFIAIRETKTVAKDGKRPQLSAHYCYDVAMWVREFANTFPGHAVCDLTKQHLYTYITAYNHLSVKSRNERRNVVRMFLKWCVRQDYLAPSHRLIEADGMSKETADSGEVQFYTSEEFRVLLGGASERAKFSGLVPVIALCGLAGVRVQEAVRLDWKDVFGVPGHVEISKSKSKTRSRRLVTMNNSLARWLAPFRGCEGAVWPKGIDMLHEDFGTLREELGIQPKRNGLRHSFCSFHFALHQNENETAAQAGNSPAMIHHHYKGLTTKAEAEKWFAVKPKRAANVIPFRGEATP